MNGHQRIRDSWVSEKAEPTAQAWPHHTGYSVHRVGGEEARFGVVGQLRLGEQLVSYDP